ncbi:MAG TPA: hypothetical protein VHI98_01115 [Vicinamibacterales bacterium]|nr:hypothetical protein [Vicinamibacterales bacterium]
MILLTTVKRGTACQLPAAWARYHTIEAARAGVAALLPEERVQRVMIVRNEVPPTFVEMGHSVVNGRHLRR